MSEKYYRVTEVSQMSGVTVRALHYYDNLGLLVPSRHTESGYRMYDEQDVLRLQQILIGRELGLSLATIRRSLDDPQFNHRKALVEQRAALVRRGQQTAAMIRSLDLVLTTLEGEETMTLAEIFDGFDPALYAEETRDRWGETEAYKESARRTKAYTEDDWRRIQAEDRHILGQLADQLAKGTAPSDEAVLEWTEKHRLHIDQWFYPCSHAMHAELADMYVADPRFRATFEKHGEGLAEFLAEAIRANGGHHA